jgi:hypothetical protein
MLSEAHSSRLGDLPHSCPEARRMAECRVVHSQIVTDLADHYFARVEANAHTFTSAKRTGT